MGRKCDMTHSALWIPQSWMSHGTYMNELHAWHDSYMRVSYAWLDSRTALQITQSWTSHGTHTNELYTWHDSYICVTYGWHDLSSPFHPSELDELRHTYGWVIRVTWLTQPSRSCRTGWVISHVSTIFICDMTHARVSHVCDITQVCESHKCDVTYSALKIGWVMSHIWMSTLNWMSWFISLSWMSHFMSTHETLCTGWRRLLGFNGSFVENDLQLRGSYESAPPCTRFTTCTDI